MNLTFYKYLSRTECTDKSGVADGNCAAGFGVCCVIATSSCSIIANNVTYVQVGNLKCNF